MSQRKIHVATLLITCLIKYDNSQVAGASSIRWNVLTASLANAGKIYFPLRSNSFILAMEYTDIEMLERRGE